MTNERYAIVRLRWHDAVTSAEPGWTTKEDAFSTAETSPPIMNSVGYVMFENDEWIAITDSVGGDEFGQITKIPKTMIIEKYILVEKPNEEINLDFDPSDYSGDF